MATKTKQVVENQMINNNKKTQLVENQQVNKKTRLERETEKLTKLNNLINKAIDGNNWDKLTAVSFNAKIEGCKLSKIAKTFLDASKLENGKSLLTDKQITLLNYSNIVTYIRNSEKYKNVNLFTLNDVKLICNAIIKANDKGTKLALKVAKQGGEIKQK